VVIAYDGSPDADLALEWGLQSAALLLADVRIVVAAMTAGRLPPQVREYEEAFAQRAAANARDASKGYSAGECEVSIEHGWTLPVLMRAASGARLVVTGSRGHNRLESHWLGSVSQHLAGHADCSVAVVRPTRRPRSRQILVGVDGSPPSVRALDFAARRAERTGECILAVHAYQVSTFSGGLGALPSDLQVAASESALRLSAELVAGIAIDHPDVILRSAAVAGGAARVLARLSDDSSLVVIGSRGRTPVQELLLGSVSQETLFRAECPVVVVR